VSVEDVCSGGGVDTGAVAERGTPVRSSRRTRGTSHEDLFPGAPRQAGPPSGFALSGDDQLYALGVSDGDLRDLLAWVVRRAVATLSDVDAASVAVGSPGEPELLVASSSLAQAADGAQFLASAGPVFDAFRSGCPVRTGDVAGDERWPSLRGWAPEGDRVGGVLALPLVRQGAVVGVLAAYSRASGGFGDDTVSGLVPFVVTAERLLRDDLRLAEVSLVNEQLAQALTSRAVIDQAKGMIMAARRCGPDEAFDVLRRISNTGNRKLRDVAAEMLADATRRP
jgi:GAF domain-containing protein